MKHTKAACNTCCEHYAYETSFNKWKGHTNNLDSAESLAKIDEYKHKCEAHELHLQTAKKEYDDYIRGCEYSKKLEKDDPVKDKKSWCYNKRVWRLSIDAKELYQLPYWGSSPQNQQSYFKRKFSVTPMGIYDEGKDCGRTYFYSELLGKTNSDHVISIIDKYIEDFCSGEEELHINLDNCAVNKNNFLVGYICLLVSLGYFKVVTLHFLIAGHTKFSPDRMFGWLDGATKHKDLYEPSDLLKPFFDALTKVDRYNAEILEKGDDMNLWREFLGPIFRKVEAITSAHWIRVSMKDGQIFVEKKETIDSEWQTWSPLKRGQKMPDICQLKNMKENELSTDKIQDLRSALRFIPSGKLSYVPNET